MSYPPPPSGEPPTPPPSGQDPYQPLPPYTPQYLPPPPISGPVMGQPGNSGLAIASMCTGIGSVVLICCSFLAIIAGGTAIALGFVALNQIKQRGQGGKGMAIAGIATGGAAIFIQIAIFVIYGFSIFANPETWSD